MRTFLDTLAPTHLVSDFGACVEEVFSRQSLGTATKYPSIRVRQLSWVGCVVWDDVRWLPFPACFAFYASL